MSRQSCIFTWQLLDDTKCQGPPFEAWVPLFVSERRQVSLARKPWGPGTTHAARLRAQGRRWLIAFLAMLFQPGPGVPPSLPWITVSPLAKRQPEKVLGQFLGMPGLQGPTPESSSPHPQLSGGLHPLPLFPSHCSYQSPNSTYFVNCTNLMGNALAKKGNGHQTSNKTKLMAHRRRNHVHLIPALK